MFLAEDAVDDILIAELKALASPESRGKWYLVLTWHNNYESSAGATEDQEILLNATTENGAIAEAKEIIPREREKASYDHILNKYTVIYKI